jgi:hypothetical protein
MVDSDSGLWYFFIDKVAPIIGSIFAFIAAGLFYMIKLLWKKEQDRIDNIESELANFANKKDVESVRSDIKSVDKKVTEILFHLIGANNHDGK